MCQTVQWSQNQWISFSHDGSCSQQDGPLCTVLEETLACTLQILTTSYCTSTSLFLTFRMSKAVVNTINMSHKSSQPLFAFLEAMVSRHRRLSCPFGRIHSIPLYSMNSEWKALATLVMFSLLQMGMAVKVCYLLMIVQKKNYRKH